MIQAAYADEVEGFKLTVHGRDFLAIPITRAARIWRFFVGPILTLPLLMLAVVLPYGFGWRNISSRTRFMLLVAVTFGVGVFGMEATLFSPHYAAPLACVMLALVLSAMRRLRDWRPRGRPVGLFMARATCAVCVSMFVIRCLAGPMHVTLSQSHVPAWDQRGPNSFGRAAVARDLQQFPGDHLVIVRYKPDHNAFAEWVYNEPDIDAAKVVWARAMTPQKDEELIHYFHDRKVWLLDGDERPAKLKPYPVTTSEGATWARASLENEIGLALRTNQGSTAPNIQTPHRAARAGISSLTSGAAIRRTQHKDEAECRDGARCRSASGGPHPNGSQAAEADKASPRGLVRPELDRNDQAIAAAIFALTVAYLWIFRRYTSMEPDEGIVLEGAQRILRGEVLYRDFFSYFTPGSYYFLALLFKIFGSSFLVARTALVFFGGVYSTVAYLLARRVCSRTSAIFVAGIVTLTTLAYRFEVLHNWDSTLWACLAVYCAVRWLESPRWTWAFATGSLASLTCLFEQSKGAGLVLGLGVGLAAVAFLDRQRSLWNRTISLGLAVGMAWPLVRDGGLLRCAAQSVPHAG